MLDKLDEKNYNKTVDVNLNNLPKVAENKSTTLAHDVIQEQYKQHKSELKSNEDFVNLTKEVVARSAKAELQKEILDILSEEQRNELAGYLLECEKQKLEYRKKKERKVIIEDVKSKIAEQKIESLKRRYGYLYKKDANGEPIEFVASKAVNKYKEYCNWWLGTSDGFKKIVKGVLRFLLWGAVVFLVATVGYELIMWLVDGVKELPDV